ncbi:MAG: FAD-dependent oxidoreductase [Thermoleophilia bacterium]|nr:FAD-dependent oxidoreductase [Thermoleophilia bacterium]MDH3725166.1 FAD-dependent oxidoreductase [Thermoleophilia bacterium]
MPSAIAIVGASLAGLRATEALRREGFEGRLTLIGDEPHLPYTRPPLSKEMLSGTWDEQRVALTTASELDELGVDVLLGSPATSLDVARRRVGLADGTSVDFEGLVIATGARARSLPGTDARSGVLTLRGLDDARRIREHLDAGPERVVVCGAGFIGAEVAASARSLGLDVTMVETAPVPFAHILGPRLGQTMADLQIGHGVDLRTGVGVDRLEGGERLERVVLNDGSSLEADVVVVGIGVTPNTEWLEGSGLTIDDGVVCDATCAAAPGIVAAGDVARWPNATFDGELMRVEHWENAVQQAAHAAATLLAGEQGGEPFAPVPWFWSGQFDLTIQLAGRTRADDEVAIIEGRADDGPLVALYGRAGRLVGVLGINRSRQVMQYRRLIGERISWDEALAMARGAEG